MVKRKINIKIKYKRKVVGYIFETKSDLVLSLNPVLFEGGFPSLPSSKVKK
jgi:hypothetical protein